MNAPTGEVTFLFTDVQGSSAAWEEQPTSMAAALAEHDLRLRAAMAEHDGYIFTTAGDSFAVAFADASAGLAAAVEAQQRLAEPAPGPEILVRMALHTGTAYERDGDYFGPVVNRSARLMSAGHGGQVLLSGRTAELVRDRLADGFGLIDLGEHQLKDLSRPERIYQVTHPTLDESFPKLRTVDAALSNLPIQLTSFVGRERELAETSELITTSRLVTLAGAGGSGKTRLAMQVAADLIDGLPGGVALVELAPITDPDLVGETVAATFGAQAGQETTLVQSIAAKIGEREILLLLDNCEHLIAPVAALVEQLLTVSPGLRVLATSQAALGIAGEVVYRVPSLALPDEHTTVADARRFDSIALFTERALLAKPSFELTPDNVGHVVDICRHLDGIPLALELAAARVGMLAPSQIAERLGKRFRLLAGGPRHADARHQTLHAAIDWSHDLLADSEKALFRRCSAFAGTFDLNAAEAVCVGGEIDEFDVLELVAALVDKSLVFVEDENDETRYRLLESVRQYALERLAESGEADEVAAAHAAYYAELAETLQQRYRSSHLAEALQGMRTDRDNLRAAIEHGLDGGDLEPAARIIGGIGYLMYVDGAFREGVEACERFFACDPDLSPSLTAAALHSYDLLVSWAEPETGAKILEREVALRRELDEPVRLAAALNNLGTSYNELGRCDEGTVALLEAVDLYRAAGESPAMSLVSLAKGHLDAGDYEPAMAYCEQALAEARHTQDAYNLALATATFGTCAVHMGRLVEARSCLNEARERYAAIGVAPGVHEADLHLALVDRAEGRTADAADRLWGFLEEAESHWFLAAKYWAFQIAASIIDDAAVAAMLLGVVNAFYEKAGVKAAAVVRPAWVCADFDLTRDRLADALGSEFDHHERAGIGQAGNELIAVAQRSLRAMTAELAGVDGDTRSSPSNPTGSRRS